MLRFVLCGVLTLLFWADVVAVLATLFSSVSVLLTICFAWVGSCVVGALIWLCCFCYLACGWSVGYLCFVVINILFIKKKKKKKKNLAGSNTS